jgi:hypothetical protein
METVPFICSSCGVEFYREEGGQCANCHKLFCIIDLYQVLVDKNTVYLCGNCKGDRKGKRGKNLNVFVRRLLRKLIREK